MRRTWLGLILRVISGRKRLYKSTEPSMNIGIIVDPDAVAKIRFAVTGLLPPLIRSDVKIAWSSAASVMCCSVAAGWHISVADASV